MSELDDLGERAAELGVRFAIVAGVVRVVECRFWTGARRSRATGTRDEAIETVVQALRESEIDLPTDTLRVELDAHAGADVRRAGAVGIDDSAR